MSLLCVISQHPEDSGAAANPRCTPMIGEHKKTCPGPHLCKGCLPKLAEPGLHVCRACHLRTADRIIDLAHLHHALLQPSKVPSQGGRGGAEKPSPITDNPSDCRDHIRAILVTWVKTLGEDWHIAYPHDTIPAMARHVHWWHLSLLADPEHADQLVYDIDTTYYWATRYAYPSRPTGQALGTCPSCGVTVRATDIYGTATCRGCGAIRTVEDWRALLIGDLPQEASATGPDIAAWLSGKYKRDVSRTAVRRWASAGIDGGQLRLSRVGTDTQSRALYSVADAAQIGHALYGPRRWPRLSTPS